MESLQSIVELSTSSLHSWREEVSSRLDDLELVLGTTKQQENQEGNNVEGRDPSTLRGMKDSMSRLMDLTRITSARTCSQLRSLGLRDSGEYFIDPDGPGPNSPPVKVYCDLKTGTTRINHQLHQQAVTPCRERGCFVRAVDYEIPMKQIISIISLSENCEQYIRYDCQSAPLNNGTEANAWWMDREDVMHFYWSGDSTMEAEYGYKGTCYCHQQQSCISNQHRCNCDPGSEVWTFDDGQLTDRAQLPVTKLNFGNFYQEDQAAKFYLGPLYCSGQPQVPLEMDSCLSLWLAGTTQSGYQIVKSNKDTFPRVVYCDMNKLPGTAGFERSYGTPGNLRHFVAFDVYINQDITDNYRYIGFTDTLFSQGGGLNVQDGIFEAPVAGVYMFTANALPLRNRPFNVQIQLNNRPIGSFSNNKSGLSMVGQSIVVELAAGDEVRLFNSGGEIAGQIYNNDINFHFIGVLLNSYNREM